MAVSNLVRSPIGGMIGGFEDFESERGQSSQPNQSSNTPNPMLNAFLQAPADFLSPGTKIATDIAKDSADAIFDLGKTILGVGEKQKFNSKGSIDFQKKDPEAQKKQQEAAVKRDFYARLENSRRNVQANSSEKAMQDAVRMEVAAMSTVDKMDSLHMNLDLDEKHINDPYHINELRRKKMEQIKAAKKQKEAQSLNQGKGGLLLNQGAQEGQSLTSSSGAIAGAG